MAIMLKNLGQDVLAMGLIGDFTGEVIEDKLRSQGISIAFQHISGSSRTNVFISEPNRRSTEILAPGPTIRPEEIDKFLAAYERSLSGYDVVVIGGSLPPGARESIYKEMVLLAKAKGLFTVLSAGGQGLANALEAAPDLVKPDVRNTPDVLGIDSATSTGRGKIAERLFSMGVSKVIIAFNGSSHAVYSADEAFEIIAPDHKIKNTVLADDAFLAGMVDALQRRRSLSEAAMWSMATEIAVGQEPEKRWAAPDEVSRYLGLVKRKEL